MRVKAGQIDGALADLTDLARLEPQNARTFVTRGLLFASQGEEDRALGDLDAAVRLDPENATLYAHRGNLRAARGELDRAIADLGESTRLDPTDADARYNLAVCRLERGQTREAIDDLDATLALQPTHAAALTNRANARRRLGEPDAALADYAAALALDPASLPALLSRAGLFASQGKHAEALADLSTLGDDTDVSLLRAEVHIAREEYEQAIAALRAPDDPRLLNNLAHLLATCPRTDLRDPTQAVELARKACTLEETPARLDTLAAALAAAGQWEEAIRTQEKAMEDAPRADREAMRERLHGYIGERGV